jgi:hypothetical protein
MNNREKHEAELNYVRAKLESAGATMMMLSPDGTRPRGYTSGWPEILRDFSDMIGAPKENSRSQPRATMAQMNELEDVETWIVALSAYCREKRIPWVAKATALSCLRWPLSGKPVMSFSKIGRRMNVSGQSVKNWYEQGVEIIAQEMGGNHEIN